MHIALTIGVIVEVSYWSGIEELSGWIRATQLMPGHIDQMLTELSDGLIYL